LVINIGYSKKKLLRRSRNNLNILGDFNSALSSCQKLLDCSDTGWIYHSFRCLAVHPTVRNFRI